MIIFAQTQSNFELGRRSNLKSQKFIEVQLTNEISAMDEMIPNEPDKSNNMEQLISHTNQTQSKKNIEQRELQIQIKNCTYYLKSLFKSINFPMYDNISAIYREHFLATFDAIKQADTFLESTPKEIKERIVLLPPLRAHKKKKTMILDLDETLIHCKETLDDNCDVVIDFQIDRDNTIQTSINIRPYAQEFLAEMSQLYEIILFTASKRVYADAIIRRLDPQAKYITKCLFRESCIIKKKMFIKDLRIFRNRDPKDIIVIDNSCYSFIHNISNGIPIIPFYDDKQDVELKSLTYLLTLLVNLDDVRPTLSLLFNLNNYSKYENPSELFTQIN